MSKPNQKTCFDDQSLRDYLHEKLDEQTEANIQEHLDECQDCQSRLEEAAAGETIWHQLRENGPSSSDIENDADDDRMHRIVEMLGPTDDPRMLGRLGNYEICGLIGQGSMGIVFKALEPALNRYVAIKVLSPVYSSQGAARKRFEREGRAVAAVMHENIVPIYAVDERCGLPYIVMQYVPGVSLLQRIDKNGALDTCEVTRVGLQVASGLAAAHKQGIVHRDVKPANVMLENTVDRAMVMDFGLARVADEGSVTQSGTIAGTPQYMSPEQAKGESVDPRSDLFSLGSLMYAACTARPPFRAETLFGVINRVCQAEPRPIRETNPNIEEWLCELIARLMSKEPGDRFQTAEEVAQVLEGELAYLQSPTAVEKPSREWRQAKPQKDGDSTTRSKAGHRIVWAAVAAAAFGFIVWSTDYGKAIGFSTGSSHVEKNLTKPLNMEGGTIEPGTVGNSGVMPNVNFASFFAEPATDVEVSDEPEVTWKELDGGDWDTGTSSTYDQKWQQAFKVSANGKLKLAVDFGDVVIRPNETPNEIAVTIMRRVVAESQGQAKLILENHEVKTTDSDEQFMVSVKRNDGLAAESSDFLKRVLVRVSLPRDFIPEIVAQNGNVTIGQLNSDVKVLAKSGEIYLDHIGGQLEIEGTGSRIDLRAGCAGGAEVLAVNSDVYLANAGGKSTLKMSGGSAWVGENPGEVYVQTSGGNIAVENTLGTTKAFALDGNVRVHMSKTPAEYCSFGAANGKLSFVIHSDVAAKVQAPIERGLEEFVAIEQDKELKTQWSERVFNEGSVVVRVHSESGDLDFQVMDASEQDGTQVSLGGSGGLGGSGLGGSGLGGSGLGGSGNGLSSGTAKKFAAAMRKLSDKPGPGKLTTVEVDDEMLDGYSLYLPVSHGTVEETQYPVLVALTGAWGVGGPIENVNHWGLARLIRDEEDMDLERNQLILDSFIVVMPHIQGGQYSDHPEKIRQIIETVVESYGGDSNRVYLTGLSRGGHGTWGLASMLPEMFAAIAPIAGNIAEVENFDTLRGPAIWIAHNSGDSSFENSEEAIEELEGRGNDRFLRLSNPDASETNYMEHRYVLTAPERDHHDAWTEMYTRPELFKWFLAHSKAELVIPESPGAEE
ncbi:MAG: protein kinase [Planctomycetota bacterium]